MNDDPLLTINETADRLRMSTRHVRRLIDRGDILALQGGRGSRVLIPESAISSYLRPKWIVRAEAVARENDETSS